MNTFVPTQADMKRMIVAFVSIHHEAGGIHLKDDIGPNAPDAPFFKRLAVTEVIDEEDYIEMADRLEKYVNSQLPEIQAIAGYPKDTNWKEALMVLKSIGEEAKLKRLENERRHAKLRAVTTACLDENNPRSGEGGASHYEEFDEKRTTSMIAQLVLLGHTLEDAEVMVVGWLVLQKETHEALLANYTVDVDEYEEVWYSKNDYEQRYPRKSKRLHLNWHHRDTELYAYMRDTIPFPSFKYDGTRMSVAIDSATIEKAIICLKKHTYNTINVENYLKGIKVNEVTTNSSGYAINLKGGALLIKLPYDDIESRSAVKAVAGRRWIGETKQWSVPISEANILIKYLSNHDTEHPLIIEMKKIEKVDTYLKEKAERIAISSAALLSDEEIVKDMKERLSLHFPSDKKLYPFQYAGVRFAELADGRCLIGDDMGIGKTMQALAYAALHEEYWPVLVISPANVKFNWVKEISTWLPKVSIQVVRTGKQELDDSDFTVINYDLASKQEYNLRALGANLIIFDESHYLKNSKAKRTQACVAVAEHADSVLCLSGTAITNRPIELFTTLEMIRPAEYKGQFFPYAKRYCGAYNNGWGWDFTGASNIEELHEKLRDCMIRRLKKEVLAELPDKVRQFIPVVPTKAEMAEYRRIHRGWMSEYAHHKAHHTLPAGFILNMLTDLRHHAGILKISATADWIAEYHEQSDRPLIVFFHHRDVGQGLFQLMEDDKRFNVSKWRVIDGGTDQEKRQQYVEQFQAGELEGMFCSTIAAKEGITLTAADTTVFIEREWVPGWEVQAEDRICRIGATGDTVWATYLTAMDTIDEKFDRIVEEKRQVVSAVLDGTAVDGTREGVATALLQAMVDAGEIPASMLQDMGGSKPKKHTEEE